MERIPHIYGSIRLVVKEELLEDQIARVRFIELVSQLEQHPHAVLVEIPKRVLAAVNNPIGDMFGELADYGFEPHYYQPCDEIMVFKGGQGKALVPPAMNAHVGVAAVIVSLNKVLLIKEERSRINRATNLPETFVVWKPITGSVNVGELPRQALVREINEEIGVALDGQIHLLDEKSSISFAKVSDTCLYYAMMVDEFPTATLTLQVKPSCNLTICRLRKASRRQNGFILINCPKAPAK